MKPNPHILCTLTATIIPLLLLLVSTMYLPIQANSDGLTLDLIHRDSPESPFYDALLTPYQRAKNAFQRSVKRAKQFASAMVVPGDGEFLMKISQGTPPFETRAIIDTGSSVTWTMCQPCNNCNKSSSSIFNPKHSSTYKHVSCSSRTCQGLYSSFFFCRGESTTCEYEIIYADRSFSGGDVASDTLTLAGAKRKKLVFPNFVFGCAHDLSGAFPKLGYGLIGLGPEQSSLISQLSSSFDAKFSYCLGPFDDFSKPGKIRFGDNKALSSKGHKVSTRLYTDSGSGYTVKLQAISVGNKRIPCNDEGESSSGNFLIDSGTTYTLLPIDVYDSFESVIRDHVGSKNIVHDPKKISNVCYHSSAEIVIPQVTMHFAGADLELNPENVFQRSPNSLFCLGFLRADFGTSILGNLAQSNFWVEYDLKNKLLSFQRANCANK